MLVPFEVAAKFLGIGTASGTRAALAMLVVAAMGRAGVLDVPASISFLTSTPALGALLAATVVEELLERDDDAQQLIAMMKYGLHGTGGVLLGYVLVERFHLPLQGWPIAVIGGAVAVLTHNLRMRVHDALRAITAGITSPRRWLSWLEAGGVIGLTVSVILAPFVALAFVVVATIAAAALWGLFGLLERARRRMCPTCGRMVRAEARLCPHCKEALPVGRWVGDGLLDRLDRHTVR
ncbi:MAG: DUF4126 family protein [Deltaproteobacteria bacterium]|nr:DUF4126 family protein [Deltaproteobacteria bacterium]